MFPVLRNLGNSNKSKINYLWKLVVNQSIFTYTKATMKTTDQ